MAQKAKTPAYHLRKFRKKDALAVAKMIERVHRITMAPYSAPDVIEYIIRTHDAQNMIERARDRVMWVAKVRDKIVGIIGLKQNEVRTFFVDPQYQGKGIGRVLFEHCYSYALKQGCKRLIVHSSSYAVPIYQRFGFERVKEIKRQKENIVYYDTYMRMSLNKNMKQDYTIISVGGSIVIPHSGFDVLFLKQFRKLIIAATKRGKKCILVIGGGATARNYQAAGKELGFKDTELDWIGIAATKVNADFVLRLFKGYAHDTVIVDPTKKIKTDKKIIIAAGWKPGCSTDKVAVLLAKTYGAIEVINLSNIDYVYDSDPKKNPQAKKFEQLTWKQLRSIVGTKWSPGANVPFDPMAVQEAQRLHLTVRFAKGTDLESVQNILTSKPHKGTIII